MGAAFLSMAATYLRRVAVLEVRRRTLSPLVVRLRVRPHPGGSQDGWAWIWSRCLANAARATGGKGKCGGQIWPASIDSGLSASTTAAARRPTHWRVDGTARGWRLAAHRLHSVGSQQAVAWGLLFCLIKEAAGVIDISTILICAPIKKNLFALSYLS
jgi:hypothetical protein